jgi:hypothetical protein
MEGAGRGGGRKRSRRSCKHHWMILREGEEIGT